MSGPSRKTADVMVRIIEVAESSGGPWTIPMIRRHLGLDSASASNAVAWLRSRGLVRRTGRRLVGHCGAHAYELVAKQEAAQ